ncbi:aromatic-ring-hydroxylating dioxygenase subunit beta [Halomonas organivorans]|uniref:3-phenylpropionate/cinnamic acid dioxygenase small subunit n=1 Tax=Halomonas organivorans TaxID=257772 RepID=A0A7W5G461_9GAMM|nr:aromatic-ring-hydroxylating dioxygenase subunit beta [Halomonas organivorans]MBB3139595.1 3-phenylpropionate/cinnamic acid dioxygenase small subunit [Halomonas organivorans]
MADNMFQQAIDFINQEADLLDHKAYSEWLGLWERDGKYVVPVDIHETDFANTLNFAYDDHAMREMRVARLQNGESVSSVAQEGTVRSMSRFRLLDEDDQAIRLRCAMFLSEVRLAKPLLYPANVEYRLTKTSKGLRLHTKVVRLLNAGHHLNTVAFIF